VAVAFFAGAAFFSTVFFSVLGSAFFAAGAAAGLASFFASFTVPEAPSEVLVRPDVGSMLQRVGGTTAVKLDAKYIPLGREKSPFSSPEVMARFTWPLKAVSETLPILLLALMYFWIA